MSAIRRNKMQLALTRRLLTLAAGIVLTGFAALSLAQDGAANGGTRSAQHASAEVPEVIATTPRQLARVEAAERVAVMPRVAGHIDGVLFVEGAEVEAGQPLFQIDPRPYALAVDIARADLEMALAKEKMASSEAMRARGLSLVAAISTEELERREASFASACAERALAEARLETAELDLEYTLVTAPISGRIGRALITAGNYVSGDGSAALAMIVSSDELDVHFDVSDRELLAAVTSSRASQVRVRVLDSATERELVAVPLDFVNNEIDPGTGTLRMRARIDGSDTGLLPGQFVLVELSRYSPAETGAAGTSAKPI